MPKTKKPSSELLSADLSFGRVSLREKALFAKHLSVMIKSGLTINESLEVIFDSTKGKLRSVLRGVIKSTQAGQSLSDSFSRYPKVFPGLFISATRAGESSGTLDESLEDLAIQMEKENALYSKIKGSLLYPAVVLGATFALSIALVFFVLPKITPLFEGLKVDLPITTIILIKFSHIIQQYGTIITIALIASAVFIFWFLRRKFMHPCTHAILLKIPIISRISKNANLSKFCRTFATLLKSGLNVDESLEITSGTMSNYYYKKALHQVSQSIKQGTRISDNLKKYTNLFPTMVVSMVRVGEESGRLEESLYYLSSFYESEVDNATKSLSTTIEPILLLIVGLAVGFLALAIITPIYSITSGIKR